MTDLNLILVVLAFTVLYVPGLMFLYAFVRAVTNPSPMTSKEFFVKLFERKKRV